MKSALSYRQILRVWFRNFVIFKRTWLVSLFWVMLEPIFVLTALGFGLGSYVKTMGGVPYAEFFFPGLLCSSTMMIAFFEGTYGNFSKLTYSKVYAAQMLAPVTIPELVLGDIFWAASKGFLSGIAILFVGSFFGLGMEWGYYAGLPVLFLNAWIFSCVGMLVTSKVKNYDQIIYPTSGFIVPMSLFAGTYFPLENINPVLRGLAYLLPLTHSVEIVRSLGLGNVSAVLTIHLAILIVLALFLTRWAVRRMTFRLQQ